VNTGCLRVILLTALRSIAAHAASARTRAWVPGKADRPACREAAKQKTVCMSHEHQERNDSGGVSAADSEDARRRSSFPLRTVMPNYCEKKVDGDFER
jgi:hypothetical protein